MNTCLKCDGPLEPIRLACERCGIEISGRFETSRLTRLSGEHQDLAERILLSGGNLKEVAEAVGVSYPTLRKRVDELIAALEALRKSDQRRADAFLEAVENGNMRPEEAARRIGEMGGGQ
ncbi:MAG TPA: DUF2089 family protein [Rhodothermales bacterium]|nr:DUF2089 family protein [Rhodothermales bacterium]